ncbi:phosphoribosylglycinamide formyltransferase [Flavobacteriaceae bacterium R38]|nr:phosphoribosylglycinamide formyltransferase [Flavobacteriaceae bacterium R38]
MNTESKELRWAILTTGWGNSAVKAIEAFNEGALNGSNIVLLVYESEPSGAAEIAKKSGIETLKIERDKFDSQVAFQRKLSEELKSREIDYIFMLAFKYIIKDEMLNMFPNRIINIHPSLFPSFLATKTAIQDALDYGVKVSGVTTHIIDDKIDEGIILCQEVIKFKEEDTFDTLYPKFTKKGKKATIDTMNLIYKQHYNK